MSRISQAKMRRLSDTESFSRVTQLPKGRQEFVPSQYGIPEFLFSWRRKGSEETQSQKPEVPAGSRQPRLYSYLQSLRAHGDARLQHAVRDAQAVHVQEEGGHQSHVRGSRPPPEDTQSPRLGGSANTVEDKVKPGREEPHHNVPVSLDPGLQAAFTPPPASPTVCFRDSSQTAEGWLLGQTRRGTSTYWVFSKVSQM